MTARERVSAVAAFECFGTTVRTVPLEDLIEQGYDR